jgi:hypothetical protein
MMMYPGGATSSLRSKINYWLDFMMMYPGGATSSLRSKSNYWLDFMMMYPGGATCLHTNCCFSEVAL